MTIRNKLYLGFGFLFLLILVVTLIGAGYIRALSADSRKILKDNYNTLKYTQVMYNCLDNFSERRGDGSFVYADPLMQLDTLNTYLKKQEENISEAGELQLTQTLRYDFNRLRELLKIQPNREDPVVTDLVLRLRRTLYAINELNLSAISAKSQVAGHTARRAILWLIVGSSACFLIALIFIFRFAAYIANPLKRLSDGISEITRKNYAQRLPIETNDELGKVAKNFNRMAEKLHEYEQSNLDHILQGKKQLEAVVNNISEGIMGLDPDRKLLFVNTPMAEILGMERRQAEGMPVDELCRQNDLFRTIAGRFPGLYASGTQATEGPVRVVVNHQELLFDTELHDAYWDMAEGNGRVLAGYVLLLRNVTPFVEKDLAKTHFIATVSHELKTPVSSIKLSLRLLEDARVGSINPEQKELIAHIQSDTDRISRIISEILNMAQVETGKLHLDVQPCLAADILEYAIQAVKVPCEQKQITILNRVNGDLPEILADMEKTAWVVINLLVNAIRYSPARGIITVSATINGNYLRISISDQGPGIPEEYRERIFEKYFKEPGKPSTSATGLGLSIAREFMEAQHGKIGLASSGEQGSTFYLTIPLRK